MTSDAARRTANAVILSAGAAAAYVVITSPPLRRFVMRALRVWLGATVPVYLMSEFGKAWAQSRP